VLAGVLIPLFVAYRTEYGYTDCEDKQCDGTEIENYVTD
jgi:hypothetical protein